MLDHESTAPPASDDDTGVLAAARRDVALRVLGSPRLISAARVGTRVVGLAGLALAVGGAAVGLDAGDPGRDEITCCVSS
jgi:hypothetical protein